MRNTVTILPRLFEPFQSCRSVWLLRKRELTKSGRRLYTLPLTALSDSGSTKKAALINLQININIQKLDPKEIYQN